MERVLHMHSNQKDEYLYSSQRKENIKNGSSAIQSHKETIPLLQKQKKKYSNAEKFVEAGKITNHCTEAAESKRID